MRATGIVYILIGIFVLLPWLLYNLKGFLNLKKNRKKPSVGRILSLVLVSLLILTAVYGHYRFTAGHQIALVAEQAGQLFTRRVEGEVDLPGYEQKMRRQGLSAPGMATVSGEDLELAGFQRKHYDLFLSERAFPMEDGSTVMYLMHSDGQVTLYTCMKLQKSGYRWQVAVHDILPREEFDQLNEKTKIKFYAVKP